MIEDFDEKLALCPPKLQTIVQEFQEAEPRERIDYLLEYAMDLPDLPERLHAQRAGMEQVHECQTPVFLHTERAEEGNDGEGAGGEGAGGQGAGGEGAPVRFFLDIPREAPTVRGYASILVSGFEGARAADVLRTPEEIYLMLGLHEAISPQRLRGLHALLLYMKRQVRALEGTNGG